ncbi:MAG: hypothetical protein QXU50_06885, partial [Candidatus Korarchaeum sp.]
ALEEDAEFRYAIAGLVGYKEILARLAEHDRKFEEILEEIRGIKERMLEHDRKFEEIAEEIRRINERLSAVESMMERFSLTLEEEAREVVSWILRSRGIQVELTSAEISGVQYDIYGETDDLIVIGEVKTRLSAAKVREFADKLDKLLKLRPYMKEKRLMKVMYAMVVQPPALEEAGAKGIVLITSKGPITEWPAT